MEQETNKTQQPEVFTMEDLKKLSVEKLKSLAYDSMVTIETQQQNLQVFRSIIAEKSEQ